MCKLLENVVWIKSLAKPDNYDYKKGDWLYFHNEEFRAQESSTRPLTTEEQVEYLYQKALNGSAKEYRGILQWYFEAVLNNTKDREYAELREYELHISFQTCDSNANAKEDVIEEFIKYLSNLNN